MIQAAELDQMNPGEILTLSGAIHRGIVEREAYTLVLAAHWADRHCPESLDDRVVGRDGSGKVIPGTERSFLFGGDGTPEVLEFAPIEFGNSLALSAGQGRALIADALDLRHRFPQLWCRTCLGEVPAWKARKVAATARHLSQEAAALVDNDVVDVITRKAWSPFLTILAGRIIAADPEAAQERAERAAKRRFVETSPSNEYGLKGIHAQAEAGDVLRFKAQVDRLAKILTAHGDTESADVRRSKAMMILANPVLAAALIASSEGVDMAEFDIEDDDLDGIVGRDRDGWHIPNYRPHPASDPDTPPDTDQSPPPPHDPENPPRPCDAPAPSDGPAQANRPHESATGRADDAPPASQAWQTEHPEAFQQPSTRRLDRPLFGTGSICAELERPCLHQPETSAPASATPTSGSTNGTPDQQRHPNHNNRHHPAANSPTDSDSDSDSNSEQRTPPNSAPGENSAQDQEPATTDPFQWENSAHHPSDDETTPPPPPEDDEPGKSARLGGIGIGAAKAMLDTIARTGLSVSKIGPTIVIYHHYADETLRDGNGVLRLDDIGPTTLHHLKDFLGPFTRITVKPVIDLNTKLQPVDSYEIPSALREHHQLQHPSDMFPWASTVSPHLEIDHIIAYQHGGPPGQTRLSGTAPLVKFSHRAKTHGSYLPRQPVPGKLVWRSPHGHIMITDHTGTHNLGNNVFAQAIWHVAVRLNAELKDPDEIQRIEDLNIDQLLTDLPRYSGIIEKRQQESDAAHRRWGHLWAEQEKRDITEDEYLSNLDYLDHLDQLANDPEYADSYYKEPDITDGQAA